MVFSEAAKNFGPEPIITDKAPASLKLRSAALLRVGGNSTCKALVATRRCCPTTLADENVSTSRAASFRVTPVNNGPLLASGTRYLKGALNSLLLTLLLLRPRLTVSSATFPVIPQADVDHVQASLLAVFVPRPDDRGRVQALCATIA